MQITIGKYILLIMSARVFWSSGFFPLVPIPFITCVARTLFPKIAVKRSIDIWKSLMDCKRSTYDKATQCETRSLSFAVWISEINEKIHSRITICEFKNTKTSTKKLLRLLLVENCLWGLTGIHYRSKYPYWSYPSDLACFWPVQLQWWVDFQVWNSFLQFLTFHLMKYSPQ